MADRSEIDEVRSRTDLVSVIEQYVTLKRNGRNLKGLCPFHSEKTPSFHVNPDLGRWHCFGQCSEGGDVFKFVEKVENLSFAEALERLALRAGVTLTRTRPRESEGGRSRTAAPELSERDRLYQLNGLALRYYRAGLAHSAFAKEYLSTRGLAYEIQETFQIGYAPDSWDGFLDYLQQQKASLVDAEKAGLIAASERGGYYEKLRGRLIFPIFDVQDRPIAFGGRLITEARPGQPKYWNSPETPLFSKRGTLYGLSKARKAIAAKGQSVIVEGYTDVLAAHQAGFEHVIATLGTALTEEHVKALARLAPTVLLAFDADSAGLQAAYRAAAVFEAHEVEVRVLDLPPGEDPDSLLRAGREAEFRACIEGALPLTEHRLVRLIRQSNVETERDRIALLRKAMLILSGVPSTVEREQYIKMLAPFHPQFSSGAIFAEEQIRQDVSGYQRGREGEYQSPRTSFAPPPPPAQTRTATDQAEKHLLRSLASGDPELSAPILAGIMPEDFTAGPMQELLRNVQNVFSADPYLDPAALLERLDSAQADLLTAILMQEEEPLTLAGVLDNIAHLKQKVKLHRLGTLKGQIERGLADRETLQEFMRLQSELKGTPNIH